MIQLQALRVVAGREATCLVTLRRGLRCFGINDEGRLGTASDQVYTAMPTRIHGILADATSVALGDDHACALNRQGGVQCWGAGGEGQLGVRGWYFPGGGDGARLALRTLPRPGEEAGTAIADDLGTVQEDRVSRTPLTVDGLATGAMQVAAGAAHSCAVTSHGRVLCWGSNAFGQLGDGSRRMRISPVDVSGLDSAVTQVALGATHSCALTSDGSVQCWGSNGRGELGDGSTQERLTPGPVNGLGATAVQITAGAFHTCALLSTGAVKCWGYDHVGQLGDGGISNSRVPVAVRGLPSRILQISAGAAHTCALADSGALYCWGDNRFGQLGTGLAGSPPNSLVAVKARAPF